MGERLRFARRIEPRVPLAARIVIYTVVGTTALAVVATVAVVMHGLVSVIAWVVR